ncbi:YjgP/YjgQ family permease [Ancylomarina euxinus]|uniref:YjgP/YjgQ family permease n=1 Tax=Ancylomarina euxinus TaxID=2283627 RepID=A0A425Y5D2_9BACT|nr:LptF/LptG family permease [Ancylomarina euxinus]MCZ4694276.1 LptF/LptG family permease [Ancylomarina euxinus]MUP14392.1 LptF/LptG family permease [Ancylomarina euxinus]RRG23702.1 YjgP/YjgQ family permease [Ancylomarina euxinus]
MKRLHSFILKSFLGPLTFTFFICMFVLLMQFLWRYIDEFVGKGLDWTVIVEFMFYVSATLVPMALPLAILLASIMSFGNMGENYELIAMKAAGISLQRIMRPLIILVIFIGLGAFYFSNYVMPVASLKTSALLYDIQHQNPELVLKEGIFTSDLPGFGIKVGQINKETGMIHDLLIYDHRDNQGNTQVTIADSGIMSTSADKLFMDLTLYSGNMYKEVKANKRKDRDKHPSQKVKFDLYKTTISLPGNELKRTDEERFRNSYRMLNLKQLSNQRDTLEDELQEEKDRLADQLSSYQYFKKESKASRKDSTRQVLLNAKIWNADSLYQQLDLSDKLTSVGNALSYSRKSKDRISRNIGIQSAKQKWIQKHVNEWHRKFTLSFACIIFFFIGAPLGAIIRKGGLGMPVIVSVLFFIIYYIISMTGERAARELVLSPFMGMWISSIVILPLGIVLTYKATTDSGILNIDVYINFFKRLNPTKLFSKKDA